MDVTAWIASELLDLRQRTARGIVGAVPSERWHERRVDGVPLVAVAWHTARHHDVAVNRIVCGEDEVLDAWADRVGIAHDTWRGLAEAEDLSLTATLDAAGVAGYLLDVLDHSIARLERGGVLAFDVVPDAAAALDALGTPRDRFDWLYAMWSDKSVAFHLRWEAVGHGFNHLGEMTALRNAMGLSPF